MGEESTGMDSDQLLSAIARCEPLAHPLTTSDTPAVRVPVERLLPLLQQARDNAALGFNMLMDHTAVDWPDRSCFELLYRLYSTSHGHALLVSAEVPRENPVAPTACQLWPVAQFLEREVYDLFGVLYDEHPDLRRVFLEDDWQGHPLRKDYQDPDMLAAP